MSKNYSVKYCSEKNRVDSNWDKPFWRDVEPAEIGLSHWPLQSEHIPRTQVKLKYDEDNLYVIFSVQDRYVRALATQIHGEVWKDSCVEFFFAPNPVHPEAYFNLEINCCGTLLAQYHTGPRENSHYLDKEDCRRIQVASSVTGPIRNEITEALCWTLEYAVPFEILAHYTDFTKPQTGVTWYANFYKCADDSSHPHWMVWSPIGQERPDFHRPDFFGCLYFM